MFYWLDHAVYPKLAVTVLYVISVEFYLLHLSCDNLFYRY